VGEAEEGTRMRGANSSFSLEFAGYSVVGHPTALTVNRKTGDQGGEKRKICRITGWIKGEYRKMPVI
jgi:hypothetical protein